MFTILMSLYYKEKAEFFDSCMRSIWFDQSVKPSEIVLVVDGPIGEELEDILQKWQTLLGGLLKAIRLPVNVGLGAALNQGLAQCSNNWVFRMDTDDICVSDRFQKQTDFIKLNPDLVLFGGQVLEFEHEVDQANTLKLVPHSQEKITAFSRYRCPFNHMTVAYRRDVILELGGYQDHLFMEDYNLWLRLIASKLPIANMKDVLVYARTGNGLYARRKGYQYVKSEKQLLNLKKQLKLQSIFSASVYFLVRSMLRMLPTGILSSIYSNVLRKKLK